MTRRGSTSGLIQRAVDSRVKRMVAVVAVAALLGIGLGAAETTTLPRAEAAEAPVNLGTASTYAVLTSGTVATVAGLPYTKVRGDLGASVAPTGFQTGAVTGATNLGATAAGAQANLLTAYNATAARTSTDTIPLALGGLTIKAGVHKIPGAASITTDLTLDGESHSDAVFIFQVGAALNMTAGFKIHLLNSAQSSNVFWQVNGATGIGANDTFIGTIMSLAGIAVGANTKFYGRALALSGAITLDSNDFYSMPPKVTIDGTSPVFTNDTTPTITGTSNLDAGANVSVSVGGETLPAVQVQSGGTWTATPPTELASQAVPYIVTASVIDGVGNSASATQNLTVDTVPPIVTITGSQTIRTKSATPTITGTSTGAAVGATVTVSITGPTLHTTTTTVLSGGGWSVTSPTLEEGPHTAAVSISDEAGNTGTASQTITVDTIEPKLTIDVPAATSTNDKTPTITGTTDLTDSTVTVTIDGQTQPAAVAANGTWSFTPLALLDGPHSIVAQATDAAGNTKSASLDLTVDTTGPAISITGGVTASTKDPKPTITGTTDLITGSTVTVTFTLPLPVQSMTASVQADGTWNVRPSEALTEGTHTVVASGVDSAGNTGTATQTLTVDMTAPTVTITGGTTALTKSKTPTIAGTSSGALPGAVVTISIVGPTVQTTTTTVNTGGAWSVTSPTLTDGMNYVTVEITDSAGNVGRDTEALTVDTTYPAVTISGSAVRSTNDTTPTVSGTTDLPAGSTITVTFPSQTGGQTVRALVQTDGTWNATSTPLTENTYDVVASGADLAGNVTSTTQLLTIDTTPPLISIAGGASVSTNDVTPTIAGTTDLPADSTVTVTVRIADEVLTTTVHAGGAWNATATTLATGAYAVSASVTDPAGNTATATQALTISGTPAVVVLTGTLTNDPTPTITGSTNVTAGSTVTVTVGGQVLTATVQLGGQWTVTVPAPVTNGLHTVVASVIDAEGNPATATLGLVVDLVPPVITIDGGATASTNDTTPTITGMTDLTAGSIVTVQIGGQTLRTLVQEDGSWNATPAVLADGTYSIAASTVDPAGNRGLATQTLTTPALLPWRICSTFPCNGYAAPGSRIRVQRQPTCGAGSTSDAWQTGAPPGGLIGSYQVGVAANQETFAVSGDGLVYHNYLDPAGEWIGWDPLSGPPGGISGGVRSGSNYLGNQELYVLGNDGLVYHLFATPGVGSGWQGWDTLGAPNGGVHGDVFEGTNYLHNQELYVLGNDGNVYHKFSTPGLGNGWSKWDSLGHPDGVTAVGDVHVAINYQCNQEIFLTATDGTTYHSYSTPGEGSGWSEWSSLGMPAGGAKGFTSTGENQDDNPELFVLGRDNVVYHNYATPGLGSGWSGWSSLGGPPGTVISPSVWVDTYPVETITVWTRAGDYSDTATPGHGSGWTGWIHG